MLAMVVAITPLLASGVAVADGSTDQKKVVEQLAAELNQLNDRIAALADQYGALQGEKATLDAATRASMTTVAAEQAQLDQLQAKVTDLAVGRFVGHNTSGLTPLFSSAAAFMEAQQFDALTAVAYDTTSGNADDLKSLVTQHDADVAKLQQQQQRAADLLKSLEQQKSDGERLVADYTKKSAAAQTKYGQLVQEEADRQAEATAAAAAAKVARQAKKDSADAASARATATPAPRGGGGTTSPSPAAGDNGSAAGSDSGASGSASAPTPTTQTPVPVASVPPPSGKAGFAIAAARSVLGTPYVAFQSTPATGFDCSGLTM
jgi:cell wall-associated NlpC family hydrolase